MADSHVLTHFTFDGFRGYRSRLDDIKLLQELMEELPSKLGLDPAMPPIMLPYYNGMVPEDCGISAFVLLRGGHFTVHTFSYGEAVFADLLHPGVYDTRQARLLLEQIFPCASVETNVIRRGNGGDTTFPRPHLIDRGVDFGPHVFLHAVPYAGPATMDQLFDLFDQLPSSVGMTPIMRPYLVKTALPYGGHVLSALTMIAESHISLHVFPDGNAFFDLFSCKFFDSEHVVSTLERELGGNVVHRMMVSRGGRFKQQRTQRHDVLEHTNRWLKVLGLVSEV
jgi:S-adenosylmethionine/arginine decarboxylase-like enzyme